MMEDLTGLGKVAESVAKLGDSKLLDKAYDDLAASPMREGGKALTDLAKAFRLFLAPIQLLAVAQDRLAAFCERVRAKVPEDRQQEAAPSIALPVLMDLRFMEDENPLTELYLNLLARAVDKERCNEAHPAFVKVIEQMSSDEAMVMYQFRQKDAWPCPFINGGITSAGDLPLGTLNEWRNICMYAQHLAALNLLELPEDQVKLEHGELVRYINAEIKVTSFGKMFVMACIPEEFDVELFRDSQSEA